MIEEAVYCAYCGDPLTEEEQEASEGEAEVEPGTLPTCNGCYETDWES